MTLPIEFLHWAGMSEYGAQQVKKILLEQPELINSKNLFNDNALIIAARTDNLETVQYLLTTPIDINHQTSEGNALMIALDKNHKLIAQAIIDNPQTDILALSSNKKNALFFAARQGNFNAIETLARKGCDINHLDENGESLLFDFIRNYSAHSKYLCFEIILSLIHSKNVLLANKSGFTILDIMTQMEKEALDNHNEIRYQKLKQQFTPLRIILNSIENN